jgi:hypothetical protein
MLGHLSNLVATWRQSTIVGQWMPRMILITCSSKPYLNLVISCAWGVCFVWILWIRRCVGMLTGTLVLFSSASPRLLERHPFRQTNSQNYSFHVYQEISRQDAEQLRCVLYICIIKSASSSSRCWPCTRRITSRPNLCTQEPNPKVPRLRRCTARLASLPRVITLHGGY